MYRELDGKRLHQTVSKLTTRVNKLFPRSGISKVSQELVELTSHTVARAQDLAKPNWRIRGSIIAMVVFGLPMPLLILPYLQFQESVNNWADFLEATDAGLHMLILLGAGILFLASLENRIRRNRTLAALSELRSISHIIDMHQLSKDPGEHGTNLPLDKEDTRTVRNDNELCNYLHFCADLLAVTGKLAAIYAQNINDRVVLDAVNEIETLASNLQIKLWHKLSMLAE